MCYIGLRFKNVFILIILTFMAATKYNAADDN